MPSQKCGGNFIATFFEFFAFRFNIINTKIFDMQKIQQFQFNQIYRAPKSTKTYELLDRSGHHLTFRVRNPKTKDSWKQTSTSTYKADQSGAFEEVLFSDGVRLRSEFLRTERKKARRTSPVTKDSITQLMIALAA